jgi:hypothetical protein
MTGAVRLEARITEVPGLSLLCPNSGVSPQAGDTEPAHTYNFIPTDLQQLLAASSGQAADVVAACRAAVAAWFERVRGAAGLVALAAVAAAARYGATVPRPAALGSGLLLPGMRRRPWLRLVRLVTARAEAEFGQARPGPAKSDKRIADLKDAAEAETEVAKLAAEQWRRALTTRGVRDMTGYLTSAAGADAAGRIPNTGRLIASYAKWHRVTEVTAYRHWRAVRELGLVRQTQHSAPGEHARYVLSFPPAQLPDGLPAGDASPQPMDLAGHTEAWTGHAGHALEEAAELELVRYGAATGSPTPTTTATKAGTGPATGPATSTDTTPNQGGHDLTAYYCQAFPLYAKVRTPSPPPQAPRRPPRRASRRGGRINVDEQTAAAGVLSDCRPQWTLQRGPDRLLTETEEQRLVPLLVLVLRHTPASEVVELLTTQVRSANDFTGVLTWRLGQTLRALRARTAQAVDEDGAIYAAKAALRAAEATERHNATTAARQAARAQMMAAITNATTRHTPTTAAHSGSDIVWATEPQPTPTTPPTGAEETASRRRYALALQRARRQKIISNEGTGRP